MKASVALGLTVGFAASLYSATPDFAPAPGSPLKIPGGGYNFSLGDVNGDKKPDLIVVNKDGLKVMFGSGTGTFEPAPITAIKLPHGAGEMLLADFNGDGWLDWAGAHHDHYDVIVMLGKGNGVFAPAPGSPFRTREGNHPHTHALATGDVNDDGKLDLVTANNSDNDVSVLLGDGKGAFTPAPGSPFPVGPGPYPLALGDVNGDSKLDIVAPNLGLPKGQITVLLGDGQGAFRPAPKSPFPTAERPYYAAIADLNGDGKPDVIASHDDSDLLTVMLGDGTGDFKMANGSPLHLGFRVFQVIAADLDRDGHADLAAAGEKGIAVLLGDGRGSFRRAKGSPFPTGKGTWRFELLDLNNDGKSDIVAGNVESNDISVLLGKQADQLR
jgi:hypothetical protein